MDPAGVSAGGWLGAGELRIALGCMRMSTDGERDDRVARATIAAALTAGITVFDTARSYGRDSTELGHNEHLLAGALRECGAADRARVVTKGGMSRVGQAWVPDGRARAILADCEASLAALDGLAIDTYLLHAPDPNTPWTTSVRALRRLLDEGMVARVGVSNVSRAQLAQAVDLAGVQVVQVALSPIDTRAVRSGLLERCEERGIALMAHSPFGGVRRARALGRLEHLAGIAASHGCTPHEVALAWLLHLSPAVVPVPGARRPETAVSAARATRVVLMPDEARRLDTAYEVTRPAAAAAPRDHAEVVMVMGIPGAGKHRIAAELEARGYVRLNRDARGGSLRDIAEALDAELASRSRHVVLDNTYLTRVARSHVIDAARRHGARVRCVWLDTPLAQAQVNMVARLLDRFGALPDPEPLRAAARAEPGLLLPTSQMRALRELEAPSTDEGLDSVERVPFVRTAPASTRPGVMVAAAALSHPAWMETLRAGDLRVPHLVFDWNAGGDRTTLDAAVDRVESVVGAPVDAALCPHAAGPPACWCRPPLPGLPLAFARRHDLDTSRCVVLGTGPAHRTMANALGARYISE